MPSITAKVQVVHSGTNGWQSTTAAFVNSVAALLVSSLPEPNSYAALLKSGIEIWHGNECPVPDEKDAPAWCYGDGIYLAEGALGFPILCANAIGHELGHISRGHFAQNLPPNVPERGVERIKTRGEWEIIAGTDELEINLMIAEFLRRSHEDTNDRKRWFRELCCYHTFAERNLAYYRARVAICEVSEMLRQLAHHDTSVTSPPQSQLYVHGQRLNDSMLSRIPELNEMQQEQVVTHAQFGEYRVPDTFSQVATLVANLEIWRTQIAEALRADHAFGEIILEMDNDK